MLTENLKLIAGTVGVAVVILIALAIVEGLLDWLEQLIAATGQDRFNDDNND